MSKEELLQEYKEIIAVVKETLEKETDWIKQFEGYQKAIINNEPRIKVMRKNFNEWEPIFAYLTISKVISLKNGSSQFAFDLRYQGQSIAELIVKKKPCNSGNTREEFTIQLQVSKATSEDNKSNFNFPKDRDNFTGPYDWNSDEAREFRKHFSHKCLRTEVASKKNQEHKVESELLTYMLTTPRSDKILGHVQPVRLCGGRFQMRTPLKASGAMKGIVNYAKKNGGGGIDILAHHEGGGFKHTHLCVIEVKDGNTSKESPQLAMKQALAYATFIWKLLRDKNNGQAWWHLFGFSQNLPENLIIYPTVAMPKGKKDEIFPGEEILLDEKDKLVLQYIYLNKESGIPIEATFPTSAK